VARRKPTYEDLLRLDGIAKHLKLKSRYPDERFTGDVINACLARVQPVVDKLLPCTGERIARGLGDHLCLTFEEVYGPQDVKALENRYLKGKKEIGFAQLRGEIARPGVDALLFERMHAAERDRDRWVAVLNLQDSNHKAYWNRFHEISHRIAEPPQGVLPFRRHQFEATNPLESLIDLIAAEIAFYGPAFQPLVERAAEKGELDLNVVELLRAQYAPSASFLSVMKAAVRYWPRPAAALVAEHRGRKNSPNSDKALRVTPHGANERARALGLVFFPNMRVSMHSPITLAFEHGLDQDELENLGAWGTSDGKKLATVDVYTSARRIGSRVYAVMSIPCTEFRSKQAGTARVRRVLSPN